MAINKRCMALDDIKSLGVLVMIWGHCCVWWCIPDEGNVAFPLDSAPKWIWDLFIPPMSVLGALANLLPFSAGMSLFWSNLVEWPLKKVMRRSLILLLLGIVAAALHQKTFVPHITWDVLNLMGASTFVIWVSLRLFKTPDASKKHRMVLWTSIMGLAFYTALYFFVGKPSGIQLIPVPHPFLNGSSQKLLTATIWGDPQSQHYYPALPWFWVVTFGYAFGFLRSKYSPVGFVPIIGILGCLGCLLSAQYQQMGISLDIHDIWGASFSQPHPVNLMNLFSITFVFWSALDYLRRIFKTDTLHGLSYLISSNITSAYLFHIFWGTLLQSIFSKNFQTPYLLQKSLFFFYVFLVFLLTAISLFLTKVWVFKKSPASKSP